ncbi:MAG: helix-turn-helix domain-containing protein [Oscillospiraceae bacterium]|jgi:excisionase family DNA binding protein|nr:helix-turn-helix domain-containing protein [Oscillospiraceae bacterium]
MSREEKMAARYRAMFREYPDALTPQQVREMLGVGQRMTYALLRGGTIPSVRMGRLYRVPKVAVIDYLCSAAENT